MRILYFLYVMSLVFLLTSGVHHPDGLNDPPRENRQIVPGAWQTDAYMHMLEGKRIAVAGNHTSMVADRHLVDTLLASGVKVVKVFSPEHGFRGEAADGELVESYVDSETGIPVISLYGRNRRPTKEQLENVDLILFDIQDVGARFYTYISTMTYIMEEASRLDIPVVVLDRPNPNRHYVDGPVLDPEYASFIGLHPVPIVYGMTIGEYARMVCGENWLIYDEQCDLTVITVAGYDHTSRYVLPLPPSPNLPNMRAVYLYPSLCLFEGTDISIGRGTGHPFQVFGHPSLPEDQFPFQFTPQSVSASPNPPQLGNKCFGRDLRDLPIEELRQKHQINLEYILEAYAHFPEKELFFNRGFEIRAGNNLLREQIKAGYTAEEIRKSWQEDLDAFKKIRAKYLLYPDYE